MVPFLVLVVSFVVFCLAGFAGVAFFRDWVTDLRFALAAMLFLTASAHWGRRRKDLVAMVPPSLPRPDAIVTITGVLEIAAAAGLLFARTAPWAGTGIALLFIPMFAANIHAARQKLSIGGTPVTALPMRAAMQVLYIAVALTAAWGHLAR
jgi:uncharacterized membrane protein